MATLEPETVEALGTLLEDARASVAILVELANGATEVHERDTCVALGHAAVLHCCALRERLTLAGAPVTTRIGGIAPHILDTERYDDRLRAFARHLAGICERTQALSQTTEDRETRKVLHEMYESGVRGALLCEQRAAAFASSRLLVFGARRATPAVPAPLDVPAVESTPAIPAGRPLSDSSDPSDPDGNGTSTHEALNELPDESIPPEDSTPRHDGASEGGER